MTLDEQKFIDAAIKRDIAIHRYNYTVRAALTTDKIDKPTAIKIRQEAAEAMVAAGIKYDTARERVTNPFVYPETT